jgi:hypothetical protein
MGVGNKLYKMDGTYSAIYSCPNLMKLEFSRQIVKNYSNIKFNENPYSGNKVYPYVQKDGLTDRHDEANSRSLQFCKRA